MDLDQDFHPIGIWTQEKVQSGSGSGSKKTDPKHFDLKLPNYETLGSPKMTHPNIRLGQFVSKLGN